MASPYAVERAAEIAVGAASVPAQRKIAIVGIVGSKEPAGDAQIVCELHRDMHVTIVIHSVVASSPVAHPKLTHRKSKKHSIIDKRLAIDNIAETRRDA